MSDGEGVVALRCRYRAGVEEVWAALTDPERLARWYGNVHGELRVGGEFTATVFASGWDGHGRVDVCVRPQALEVSLWEADGAEAVVAAELAADGDDTVLVLERRSVPLDLLWAYGAGWHEHLEDLAAHLAGDDVADRTARGDSRFDELTPRYQQMAVTPLDR